MVCGRLPWNVLDFWLETFRVVSHLVLFEAMRVPWFAGGYHGTFWIFGLKPSGLFPIWCCLRPGASHGLRAATMERSGFSKFQSDPVINWKFQSVPVINWNFQSDPVITRKFQLDPVKIRSFSQIQ